MHGGAITLSRMFLESDFKPDLILVTDMLDVNLLLSLLGDRVTGVPVVLYMHENQLNYPWSPQDRDSGSGRDHHYAFINYASALRADRVVFNSQYHRSAFLDELPGYLRMYPDFREAANVDIISKKSVVLPIGLDLVDMEGGESVERPHDISVILWNHRWEYDKGPEVFFALVERLLADGEDFRLIVCGERSDKYPRIFDEAREQFAHLALHWGYAQDRREYASLLRRATVLPVTSNQDFFGISAVEAMYAGVAPIMPDRLAFPEHVPSEFHDTYLYTTEDELYHKVKRALKASRQPGRIRSWVSGYDWRTVIEDYDALFSSFSS